MGDPPSLVDRTHHPGRDPDIGKEDLVEVGHSVNPAKSAGCQFPGWHVDEEEGNALVFGHIGIRANQGWPIAVMGKGSPDLLPVDDPCLGAVALGTGPQAGQIRACPRLAEELAPHLVANQGSTGGPPLLLMVPHSNERGPYHSHANGQCAGTDLEPRHLLIEDRLFDRCPSPAAVLGWPGDAGPTAVVDFRCHSLQARTCRS